MKPFFVTDKKNSKKVLVPCGSCPNCLARKASAWSFRLMQQEKISKSAWFLTLTYATDHLPITSNGYATINKRDLQLFFKRLRKSHVGSAASEIKYYAVGEYGGKLKRPHYHVILFNARLDKISPSWGLGHCHYGKVEGASVGYTLKYISKPQKNFAINDDRERPFSLMSKGIGESYITAEMVAWHKGDLNNRMYCNLLDGKKCTMPRYYKERIYTEEERKQITQACKDKFVEQILADVLRFEPKVLDKKLRDRTKSKEQQYKKHRFETSKLY